MQGFAWILMGFPKLAQMIINIMSWCCAPWEVSLWKGLDTLGQSQYAASIPVQVQQVANSSHDIPKLSKEKHENFGHYEGLDFVLIEAATWMDQKILGDITNFQVMSHYNLKLLSE